MSPPADVWRAEHKLHQLHVASSVGLAIPPTIVTNDAREARDAFRRFNGRMIAKPVKTGFFDLAQEQRAVFTTKLLREHLDTAALELSPVIYQPLLPKRYDLRITAVGDKLFPVAIHSQTDPAAVVDWRQTTNPDLPHSRATIPPTLAAAIRRLLRTLGLRFGALDFVRTPEGKLIFLEVNPNGQWLWLDDKLQLGISEEIANWLSGQASTIHLG